MGVCNIFFYSLHLSGGGMVPLACGNGNGNQWHQPLVPWGCLLATPKDALISLICGYANSAQRILPRQAGL